MNTHRDKFLASRRSNRTAGVFSPKVAPDPTVQKQLEERVQAVLVKTQRQNRTASPPPRICRFFPNMGVYHGVELTACK